VSTGTAPGEIVLVRHGEAVCNVEGIVGGRLGCTGLTVEGRRQVGALAARLERTGELAGVTALYASVLPRALETAEILRPALEAWRDGPPLEIVADCGLCELHPGEADGLDWTAYIERYGEPLPDRDPFRPIAPGAESWSSFVARASGAVAAVADAHPGGRVVVACHAGVVESTILRFLPAIPPSGRLDLPTRHASMTRWARGDDRWLLLGYNDATPSGT